MLIQAVDGYFFSQFNLSTNIGEDFMKTGLV